LVYHPALTPAGAGHTPCPTLAPTAPPRPAGAPRPPAQAPGPARFFGQGQELWQQRGGRGQGWRLRHPERRAGLGLDRREPAPLLHCDSAWPGWGFCLAGAPWGADGSAGAARSARKPR
jgi:hypothetical protein